MAFSFLQATWPTHRKLKTWEASKKQELGNGSGIPKKVSWSGDLEESCWLASSDGIFAGDSDQRSDCRIVGRGSSVPGEATQATKIQLELKSFHLSAIWVIRLDGYDLMIDGLMV